MRKRNLVNALINTVRQPVLVLDKDFTIHSANQAEKKSP
jgi:nitrogen-specific signal transduction histidine kinase